MHDCVRSGDIVWPLYLLFGVRAGCHQPLPRQRLVCSLHLVLSVIQPTLSSLTLHFSFQHTTSVDLVGSLESMWNDYRTASLWGFQSGSSSGLFEREDFYETSENLLSLGLVFEQIGYCIRVLHDDRAEYERKARESYAKLFPNMPYVGMLAVNQDPTSPIGFNITVQREKPFYYPCPYQIFPTDRRFDFFRAVDLQSGNMHIDESVLEVGQPVLSNILTFADLDNPEEKVRIVSMLHPGRNGTFSNGLPSLATITIRPDKMITKLLKSQSLGEILSVYLFDTTGDSGFAGLNLLGVQQEVDPKEQFVVGAHCVHEADDMDTNIEVIPDAEIESSET